MLNIIYLWEIVDKYILMSETTVLILGVCNFTVNYYLLLFPEVNYYFTVIIFYLNWVVHLQLLLLIFTNFPSINCSTFFFGGGGGGGLDCNQCATHCVPPTPFVDPKYYQLQLKEYTIHFIVKLVIFILKHLCKIHLSKTCSRVRYKVVSHRKRAVSLANAHCQK